MKFPKIPGVTVTNFLRQAINAVRKARGGGVDNPMPVPEFLKSSAIAPNQIDRVFLTGGTSFVPAVRRIFESSFTPARVRTGNEFTSVAQGLALRALESSMQT